MIIILLIVLLNLYLPAPPPYFVMIVDKDKPSLRCGGILIGPRDILTANHCFKMPGKDTIVTQYGGEDTFVIAHRWKDADIALLHSNHDLFSPEYARIAPLDSSQPVIVFGACPRFFGHIPRAITFLYDIGEDSFYRQAYYTYDSICGGDSGSPLTQDGYVVGIVASTVTLSFTMTTVQIMYAIPPTVIMETLSWPTASNN